MCCLSFFGVDFLQSQPRKALLKEVGSHYASERKDCLFITWNGLPLANTWVTYSELTMTHP